MATNITVTGLDLDSIFKSRVTFKTSDVGIQVTGLDISNRYERSYGTGDRIKFNTNYSGIGIDLRSIFVSITFSGLTENITPSTVSATCVHPCTATTPSLTALPSGGVGPYTYSWQWVTIVPNATINSATSVSTTFSLTSAAISGAGGSARCLVTDFEGRTGATSPSTVSFTIT